MAKITYDFDYNNGDASCVFIVDTDKYTAEHANSTLGFFHWDYDKDADPIDEVMKKYARKAILFATQNGHNEAGVISDFEEAEGYNKVDGSAGITLTYISEIEFLEEWLSFTKQTNQP